MSSASDSKCSPQPPNWQMLEKKEAAAMPVMVFATLKSSSTGRAERGSHALARTLGHRQADSGSSWSSAGRERATQQEREEGPPSHVIPVDMKYCSRPAPQDTVRVFICESSLRGAI